MKRKQHSSQVSGYSSTPNAIRIEECRRDLPASGRQSIPKANWQKLGGICGRPGRHVLGIQDKRQRDKASLNRFLSKTAEKSLPFFKTLKKYTKKSDFQWTTKAEAAFKQMKKLIAKLPTLTAPMEKEELIVYLAAAKEVVTAVLMMEREAKQMPIYFFSRVLQGPEINYTPMENLVLALVHASKRIKRYFQAHTIIVITDQPIKQVSSCIDGSGAGLILTNSKRAEFTYALRFKFDATNNEAEYEALIADLRIAKQIVLAVVEEEGDTWMTLIYEYLTKETLPAEKEKARAVRRKSRRYAIINGVLYKKSYLGSWLWCVGPLQANYVLREIHEGSCSMHAGTRSLVAKAMRTGYYWPIMHADARKMIRECQDCQTFPGRTWFGLPGEITSDNGKQFKDNPFKDLYEKLCIRQRFASVKHPQADDLVERANRSLGEGIKARLDERSKD
ncbi:reverse transcriptase domain-containing protein [Tanacetum coccineum]